LNQSRIKICFKCSTPFECGLCTKAMNCWCADYPRIEKIKKGEDCFCPECLKEEIAVKIKEFVDDFRSGKIKNTAPKFQNKHLVQELDYYLEDGKYVFTEWFLLKRGYCCDNQCRHCPYSKQNSHAK